MKDLAALNIYSIEELDGCKFIRVRTPEDCVQQEERAQAIKLAISEIEKNRLEYKNDSLVKRILIRLESALNFINKSCAGFTGVANAVIAQRDELEERRKSTMKKIDDSKLERAAAVAAAKSKLELPEPATVADEVIAAVKRKPGRPKKKK